MSIAAVLSLEGFSPEDAGDAQPTPPPFRRVAGVPLLTRQILTLLHNGADKIWLVPGKHGTLARGLIQSDRRLRSAPIEVVAGEREPALSEAIEKASRAEGVSRVLLAGGNLHFGAGLVRYIGNGVAADGVRRWGEKLPLFYGEPQALSQGTEALGAAPILAESQRPQDKDAYVVALNTPSDARAAKRAIFANVTKPTSGWVSKNINAKLSIPLSKILSETPMTPNMMTLITTVVGILSGPLLARGDYFGVFWGGLCFQLASALDRCDGELARSKFLASEWGEWIDTIGDNITYVVFLIGLTIGTYRRTETELVLYAGFGLVFLAVAVLGIMYRYLLQNTKSGSLVAVYKDMEERLEGQEKPLVYRFLDKIRFMGKRDFYSLAVFVICAFNQLVFLFIAAMIAVVSILLYILSGKSRVAAAKKA